MNLCRLRSPCCSTNEHGTHQGPFRGSFLLPETHGTQDVEMEKEMGLTHLTIDKAQYLLDNGYASLADAEEYAETWNKHKIETRCRVEVQNRRGNPKWPVLATPTLILEDVE